MRIAYVIPAYPPLASQPFVVNEMLEVEAAGHELTVLGLYRQRTPAVRHGTFERLRPAHVLPAALADPGTLALAVWVACRHPVRVGRTLGGLHRAAGTNLWAHAKLLAVTPKALAAAWRLRRLGVEHVHAHFANQTADCAAIAAVVAGIPFSFTAHAYDVYSRAPRQRNETLGWKLRHAARAFAVSDYGARLLRAAFGDGAADRVCTAYVGIPTELFRAEPPVAGTASPIRLLAVARLCEKKGLDTLVDACARCRDRGVTVALDVFGDGPLRAALEARAAALGLADVVHFGGGVPQEEIARRMRACHAFVLPCRRDRDGDMDGIPTVFMEAMATGRPVVSTAISGIPELVRDGVTGLVVPPDDPAALADAIARLAADPALRARLGAAARALVERQHDQRRNARRVIALLEEAHEPACAARA
jgi:glycosyltransferase involved in cell wall biosynthesis